MSSIGSVSSRSSGSNRNTTGGGAMHKETPGVKKQKPRGRPKNAIVIDKNQRSIMIMFKPIR